MSGLPGLHSPHYPMYYPRVTLCQAGLQALSVVASRGVGFQPVWMHPLHRSQVLAVIAGTQAGRLPHSLIQRLPPLLSSTSRS